MSIRETLNVNMRRGEYYTEGTIKKMLCPTQSTTAERLFNDAYCAGYLQEGISTTANRVFRVNQ